MPWQSGWFNHVPFQPYWLISSRRASICWRVSLARRRSYSIGKIDPFGPSRKILLAQHSVTPSGCLFTGQMPFCVWISGLPYSERQPRSPAPESAARWRSPPGPREPSAPGCKSRSACHHGDRKGHGWSDLLRWHRQRSSRGCRGSFAKTENRPQQGQASAQRHGTTA